MYWSVLLWFFDVQCWAVTQATPGHPFPSGTGEKDLFWCVGKTLVIVQMCERIEECDLQCSWKAGVTALQFGSECIQMHLQQQQKRLYTHSFSFSHHLSCKYGNSSQLPWQQKQMWRAFSCVMRCELLTSAYKKRNGSNGYGFMSVWAVAILPLTQLGTPYATVCIFYDVGLLTCKEWTIYFAHGLWGFAEEHAHTVCRNYTPINCFFCYFCI